MCGCCSSSTSCSGGRGISEKTRIFFCKNDNFDDNDDGEQGTRGGGGQTAKMPAEVMMVELITFEILAAERLRLMGFDNRLIIDCSSNIVNILIYGNFLQMIDSEVRNMNALLGKFISRNEMCQFIIKNTSQ